LHLWKNYAYYALESPVQNGFLAPTWEEMFSALLLGTGNRKYIEPLEMEMNEAAARSPMQDMNASMDAVIDESTASFNVPLKEIAEALRSDLKVKALKYHFQTYHNSFRGTDAVDFLVKSKLAASRERAVMIGRRLAKEMKVFQHVTGKHEFKDEPLFYIFLKYETSTPSKPTGLRERSISDVSDSCPKEIVQRRNCISKMPTRRRTIQDLQ
jgi:hypothetical protein